MNFKLNIKYALQLFKNQKLFKKFAKKNLNNLT